MKTQISRECARPLRMMMLPVFLLALLISTTACSPRYVAIPPGETIQANKTQLDQLYRDNEDLLKALEQCRSKQ